MRCSTEPLNRYNITNMLLSIFFTNVHLLYYIISSSGAKMSVTFPDTMRDIRIRPVMTQIIVLRCRHSDGIIIVGMLIADY